MRNFYSWGVEAGTFVLKGSQFPVLVPPLIRGVRGVMQDLTKKMGYKPRPSRATFIYAKLFAALSCFTSNDCLRVQG
jgi:hypothetical protein